MARTAITLTNLSLNGGVAPSTTNADVANGHSIAVGGKTSKLVIHAKNTNGSDRVLTVKAGVNPPGLRSGLGDLAVTVPATTGERLIVIESARFVQADGTIWIDLAASFAGTIAAYILPAGV